MPDYVSTLLTQAGVHFAPFTPPGAKSAFTGVYISEAFQLIGSHKANQALCSKLPKTDIASTWESHHVVERNNLDMLGIGLLFPVYEDQLTVLIPKKAHQERVSGRLRSWGSLTSKMSAKEIVADLIEGYRDTYGDIGDYTGAGEPRIKKELMAIVRTTFRRAGLD